MSSPTNSDDFLKSPLVIWIQSYLDAPITSNVNLSNGVLLNKVLTLIDPTVFSGLRLQNAGINDITSRAHNLAEILHSIKRFYLEKLQQIVVLKIPDILMLAKEPNNELSHSEMSTILLLILGCAIQCEKKEEFIEHIKELTVDVQRGLVASIQEITENSQNVIPYRASELPELSQEDLVNLSESLYYQLQNVLEQRDDYVEAMLDLALVHETGEEMDVVEESPRFRPRNPLSPRTSFRSTNILQANRQRMQTIQSELDDRHALVAELKEELEQMKLQLDNIRLENKELVNEAGWAKSYRDELDIVKVQLENTTKIQNENTKLKEKVRDMEFYKKSYLQIKEQSDVLYESKLVLEEKVAGSNSKMSRFAHLEEENNRLYAQVKLLMEERQEDQNKIRDLVDEVAKLSIEKQESLSACSVMNAELDGLKMQKQDDGLNVPLLLEYNQSTSTDIMRLERENKHLSDLVENLRNTTIDTRLQELQNDNTNLSANIVDYKNMITKLTKSLLSERNNSHELGVVIGSQKDNIKNLQGTLTKRSSELEQTNAELESLASELAVKGVVVDSSVLKDALSNDEVLNSQYSSGDNIAAVNGKKPATIVSLEKQVKEAKACNVKLQEDLAMKLKDVTTLESKVKQVETYGKKVEEQLQQREKDIDELERRFENNKTENKTLSQNAVIHRDKISALEERVEHLMSSASEDTRKINKSLEQKLQRISELETKLFQVKEVAKDHQRTEEQLKKKLGQNEKLEKTVEHHEEEMRSLELQFEKAKSTCMKLEHCVKLKDERIASLESNVDKLSENANNKQSERIDLLMQSLNTRASDIAELENKVEELIRLNNKLKTSNRSKNDQVQELEDRISELEGQLDGKNSQQVQDDRIKVLNKQLTEREGQIDELEVKLDEANNTSSKLNRTIQHRDEKILELEQKLQEVEELAHQHDLLSQRLDDRLKKILDLEMQLDKFQNDNNKLTRTLAQKEEEYATATKSLGTLEASITDQSSLSKLIQLKDTKIQSLNGTLDEKDEEIVDLRERLSDCDRDLKKLTHTLKLREEKLANMEKSFDKLKELEGKNAKLSSTIEQKDNKICNLENSLDQLNEFSRSNNRLKENLHAKDEKINTLEQRIDDLQEAVKMNERLNQQVKQKEERIVLLQERVEALESQVHKLEQQRDKTKQTAECEIQKLSAQNLELSEVKVKRQMSIMRREKKIVNLETKLNEYASEKEEKESRIQDLQAKLEGTMSQLGLRTGDKDKKLFEMEQRVKELQETYRENQKLSRALTEKQEELATIKKQLEEFDVKNTKTLHQLADKEENVRELQERLEETLALNNRLNHSVKKQEEKFKALECNLQQNEINLEKLSVEVETKDRTIERNKERQEELQKQLLAKEQEIIDLDKQISTLKTGVVERNRLVLSIKEKESIITDLQEKIQAIPKNKNEEIIKALRQKETEVEALQKKTNDHASERHKTKLQLQEKDGVIADLERRIEELQLTVSGSDKLNNVVKEKNNQITLLRQSLDELQSHTAQLETRVEQLSSDQTKAMHAINQKEERLRILKSQLEEYVNKNHGLTNDLQMKVEELKSLKKSLVEMTARNKDLEEDINMLEKDLEELKKTGSLKNITNITEKIQLTKRARTELHIQRGPPKKLTQQAQKIEIKMSPNKYEDSHTRETIDKLQEGNDLLEKQKSQLTDQIKSLSSQNAALLSKNETLRSDYDLLKSDYEGIQQEMNEAREHFQELDVSATKIAHRCEVLVQLNATLEEENKALMDQVNKLLAQNQELLMTTLHSRDQYIDEERTFTDHIYELEREREKLSEKVLAAEKALQESGNKKKGVLWRGTRKILKKAGLAKKKDSNASGTLSPEYDSNMFSDSSTSPTSTPSRPKFTSYDSVQPSSVRSPVGPIRGLLSRSRQDISQIDNSVVMRRPAALTYSGSSASDASNRHTAFNKVRPKSEFRPSFSGADYESPVSTRRQLHRPRSMENIRAQESVDTEDDCDIIPLDKKVHPLLDRKSSLPIERKDSTLSRVSQKRAVASNPNSTSSTPISSRKSSGPNTPIQKVRVTQITTAQVMKASPETVTVDYIARQALDFSPRSNRKQPRASTFTSTPVPRDQKSRNGDFVEPLLLSRNNSLRTGRIRSDQNRSFDSTDDSRSITSGGSLSHRSNEEVRRLNRSESFSPPASNAPFGTREQRSSFRRYEIEQMEPRVLPSTRGSDSDEEATAPPRPPRSSLVELTAQRFGERAAVKKYETGSTPSQDKTSDLKRTDSERKKNPSWYEYGSV